MSELGTPARLDPEATEPRLERAGTRRRPLFPPPERRRKLRAVAAALADDWRARELSAWLGWSGRALFTGAQLAALVIQEQLLAKAPDERGRRMIRTALREDLPLVARELLEA